MLLEQIAQVFVLWLAWAMALNIYTSPPIQYSSGHRHIPDHALNANISTRNFHRSIESNKYVHYMNDNILTLPRLTANCIFLSKIIIKAVDMPNFIHNTSNGPIEFGPVFNRDFLMEVYDMQQNIKSIHMHKQLKSANWALLICIISHIFINSCRAWCQHNP